MGRILFTAGGHHSGHEGFLEYLLREPLVLPALFADEASTVWEGWTTLYAIGVDELRCAVRAGCDCGWHGAELPWPGGEPTAEQQDALMAVWEFTHAGPIREALERRPSDLAG